jgi:hypothetical protein
LKQQCEDTKFLIGILLLYISFGDFCSGADRAEIINFVLKKMKFYFCESNIYLPSHLIPFFDITFNHFLNSNLLTLSPELSSSVSSSTSALPRMGFFYVVFVFNILDQLFYYNDQNISIFLNHNPSEILKSSFQDLGNLSDIHSLFVIHHSLFFIYTISSKVKTSSIIESDFYNNDFISVFSPLLSNLKNIFLKSAEMKKISLIFSSFIKLFNCLAELCKKNAKKFVEVEKENGLVHDSFDVIYNVVERIPKLKEVGEDICSFIKCVNNLFNSLLRDYLPVEEMQLLVGKIINCLKELINIPEKPIIPEFILEFLLNCSYLGIKIGKNMNVFSETKGTKQKDKNEDLLTIFNYFNELLCSDNEEKVIIRKWYCSITFGYLNKGKGVEEKFSKILLFLKEVKEGKYPIIDSEKKMIAGNAFEFVSNAKDLSK